LTVKLNTLVPPLPAIAVEFAQVIALLAALHVQLAPLVSPVVIAPLVTLKPVGKTSTIVTVPLEAMLPLFVTVSVYVVVVPATTEATPSVFASPRFTKFVESLSVAQPLFGVSVAVH